MTHIVLIMIVISLVLAPTRAYPQKISVPETQKDSKKEKPPFFLSDSDFDSIDNPFVDKLTPTAPPAPPPQEEIAIKPPEPTPTEQPPQQIPAPLARPPQAPVKPKPKPAASAQIKLPSFTINGLVWDTDIPQAIVNNKIIKIGDDVDGSVITAIDQTGIEVLYEGKKFKVLYK